MKEYELKYGCNPNQKPARVFMENGADLPMEILNGRPGYINLLDAMNSWQLVREIREALGVCAATSFKHVSPTSAAIGLPMSEIYALMRKKFSATYDLTGSIGKRYRRQDEIGTPYCVTVDFQTLEDGTVTVRDRDSMEQIRVSVEDAIKYVEEKIEF